MVDSVLSTQSYIMTETCTKKVAQTDSVDTTNGAVNKIYPRKIPGFFEFKTEIIWYVVLWMFVLHVVGIYGILTFDYFENMKTTSWILLMHMLTIFGVSGGAHRLWSHKSYKAKLPLRILLVLLFSAAGQNSIYIWVRNHRLHHKYCDTDADPHNNTRGFFFAHIGWVMMAEHPKVTEKSKKLDLSDILSDPVVVFNKKHSLLLQFIFGCVLPTFVPVYFWNETWGRAIISQIFIRYIIGMSTIWSINSIAHKWGYKPYNRHIGPVNNDIMHVLTCGEGLHNYHHVFPWDYRSADIGDTMTYTTFFIEMFAKLGQAYDLKFPSVDLVKNVAMTKGDGSYSTVYEVPMPECKAN